MDLEKAIRELLAERDRICGIIAQLELIERDRSPKAVRKPRMSIPEAPIPEVRGRKKMSDAERETVSNRMREYWARRRAREPSSTEPMT